MSSTVSIANAALACVLVGAVGFALGRSTAQPVIVAGPTQPTITADPPPFNANDPSGGNDLPPGHPKIENNGDLPPVGSATIKWTAPARWQSVPNPSAMRLATFKIPHAAGDAEDAELSVTQVGGSVDSNIERWIGQFDAAGQKTAKKTTKTVKGWKVTFVEIEGSFSGGMGGGGPQNGWGLEGAIVETPGMPHFFKMTGPAKTVKAARAELEGLIDTIAPI
jgi:hypothetical protein